MKYLFLLTIISSFSIAELSYRFGNGCGVASLSQRAEGATFNKSFNYTELNDCTNGVVQLQLQKMVKTLLIVRKLTMSEVLIVLLRLLMVVTFLQ